MSKTSVVIPCYKEDQFLKDALDSVAAQSQPVLEIIVVDDGSPVELVRPVNWSGPKLVWVRTENRGLGAARNEGVRHASGEYVAFLDADDLWEPEKIARQEVLLDTNPEAVACYTRCVKEDGYFEFGPFPERRLSRVELSVHLWTTLFFPPSSVLARRSVIGQVNGFAEGLANGEDLEMWIKLLSVGDILEVPEALTKYRVHGLQISANEVRKVMGAKRARELVVANHSDLLIAGGIARQDLWKGYRETVFRTYYRRNFPAARTMLWDYWKDHPSDVRAAVYLMVSCLPSRLITAIRDK